MFYSSQCSFIWKHFCCLSKFYGGIESMNNPQIQCKLQNYVLLNMCLPHQGGNYITHLYSITRYKIMAYGRS